jgi:hypothetical protein
MLQDKDREKSKRVMATMLKVKRAHERDASGASTSGH